MPSPLRADHPLITRLHSAVLAAFFLGERLGKIGISGCSLCFVGSLVIVLHAPEDKDIATVDEMLEYALQPGTAISRRRLCPAFVPV